MQQSTQTNLLLYCLSHFLKDFAGTGGQVAEEFADMQDHMHLPPSTRQAGSAMKV